MGAIIEIGGYIRGCAEEMRLKQVKQQYSKDQLAYNKFSVYE